MNKKMNNENIQKQINTMNIYILQYIDSNTCHLKKNSDRMKDGRQKVQVLNIGLNIKTGKMRMLK